MKDLDRTFRAGAGDVLSSQGDLFFIEIDRRERHASRASGQRQPQTGVATAATQLEKCALRRRHRQKRKAAPDVHGYTAKRRLIACRLFLERAHDLLHVRGNVMKHLRLPRDFRTARCAD